MSEYLVDCVGGEVRRERKQLKKNKAGCWIILMLVMSIFFCVRFENYAQASKLPDEYSQGTYFKLEYGEVINEFANIELPQGDLKLDNNCKINWADEMKKTEAKASEQRKPVAPEVYSIEKVIAKKLGAMGELVVEASNLSGKEPKQSRSEEYKEEQHKENEQQAGRILRLVTGYPIEEMIPYIAARNEEVAYYLVAIAKKESDWGKHSPQKNGGTCYNYWGYRGTYNQTDSGYSCFDSPAQAIEQVGNRIENLLDKKIDTPEEMVVWKCGSTCAGHDPQGVLKWISDVKLYYNKLNS